MPQLQEQFEEVWIEALRGEHPETIMATLLRGQSLTDNMYYAFNLARTILEARDAFDADMGAYTRKYHHQEQRKLHFDFPEIRCNFCGSPHCDQLKFMLKQLLITGKV